MAGNDRAGGMPQPIITRLNAEVVSLLKQPATIERLRAFGNEPAPSTPEEFKKRLADDIATWTALADEISLPADLRRRSNSHCA